MKKPTATLSIGDESLTLSQKEVFQILEALYWTGDSTKDKSYHKIYDDIHDLWHQ